ncbi:MAG: alpha/beta fold hydrolase [Candidatus Aenigmatarchaeota archaeon]
MKYPIVFKVHNQRVFGTLHKSKSKSGVIICHGLARNRCENLYVSIANYLEKENFNVLRFDFRGFGESEGKSEFFDHFTEVEDIEASISFLNKKGIRKIGLVAHSHAAIISIMAAFQDKRINTIVCWNGAFRPLKFWSKTEIKEIEKKGYIYYRGIKFGKRLYQKAREIEPLKYFTKITIPVLLIHSIADKNVPVEESVFTYSHLKKYTKVKFKKIRTGDHFLTDPKVRKRVFKITADWFKDQL